MLPRALTTSINGSPGNIFIRLDAQRGDPGPGLCPGAGRLQGDLPGRAPHPGGVHHLLQDVAGLRVQRKLADHYFALFGYDPSTIFQGCHQWNGPFPRDESRAAAIISLATASAVLGGAQRIMVKTPQEGLGFPTVEARDPLELMIDDLREVRTPLKA